MVIIWYRRSSFCFYEPFHYDILFGPQVSNQLLHVFIAFSMYLVSKNQDFEKLFKSSHLHSYISNSNTNNFNMNNSLSTSNTLQQKCSWVFEHNLNSYHQISWISIKIFCRHRISLHIYLQFLFWFFYAILIKSYNFSIKKFNSFNLTLSDRM